MPKGKRNQSRGKKAPRRANGAQHSGTSVRYRGPIAPPAAGQATQIIPVRLTVAARIPSNSSGILNFKATNNPSGTVDWSSFANLFSEYRVLATKLNWVPDEVGFSTTVSPTQQRGAVLYNERSAAGNFVAPVSLSAAWDNDGARVHNIGRSASRTLFMDGGADALWRGTQAVNETWAIGFYAEALTASQFYGTFFVEYLVQFRSRF